MSRALCEFVRVTSPDERVVWRCSVCGHITPIPLAKAPMRNCDVQDGRPQPRKSKIDPALAWLICPCRGDVLVTINARAAGCGCSSSEVEIYRCNHFNEPVLKSAGQTQSCFERISLKVIGYTGRTCRQCLVPLDADTTPLPIPDGGLSQATNQGIITGASAVHWPCLGAIAIAAYQYGLPFAIADHGLKGWQRSELVRCGVSWIEHHQPELSEVKQASSIPSDLRAWWKPWICLASPFRVSLWIDSDAVPVAGVSEVLTAAETRPQISTQGIWQDDGVRLYHELVSMLFGEPGADLVPRFSKVNSGVLAWRQDEPLIREWQAWCLRLMSDSELTRLCRVRDQAGLAVTLVDLALRGGPDCDLLPNAWNVAADYLPARESKRRKPISLQPTRLLAEARDRHPEAKIVHWLGGVKPWKIVAG